MVAAKFRDELRSLRREVTKLRNERDRLLRKLSGNHVRAAPEPSTEPIATRRANGGWLVVSGPGESIRIGVTADTEKEARDLFATTLLQWKETLSEDREKSRGTLGGGHGEG